MKRLANKALFWHIANIRFAVCLVLLLATAISSRAQQRFFLHFPWNDSQWAESYFDNREAVDSLVRFIDSIGPENIEGMDVVAYASPEGSYLHNLKLSRERADQFNRLLNDRLPAVPANITAGGEAWALLMERVVNDPKIRPDLKKKILRILDDATISNDTRKWRLANRLDISDYRYLLYAHYRYLRCIDIVIRVKEPEPILETEPEPVPEPVQEPQQEPEPTVEPVVEVTIPEPVKKKPVLAISTNIPYDIIYIPKYGLTSAPSLSLEYYPANYGHWTFGADVDFPMWQHWKTHRFFQIQNLTLNTRYYLKTGNYHGLYLLANINAAKYGIGWDAKGWEGEGFGASVGAGFKLTLYKRLFLDAGIALGYFNSRYDPYEYGFDSTKRYYYNYVGVPQDFVRRNHTLNWFGPTRVRISIGFELFGRKVER
ncbi:MAG: DUF3575 domain-containing protein [Elusimicrobiaceae bacterium]|nr:DUF3575 domain-containing protein [Elusimicrobiaceae bacterium]